MCNWRFADDYLNFDNINLNLNFDNINLNLDDDNLFHNVIDQHEHDDRRSVQRMVLCLGMQQRGWRLDLCFQRLLFLCDWVRVPG